MERGAVGFVLRLSRVMGIAPYPRGSRVQVSKALVIYGFVFATLLSFYVLSMTYYLNIMKIKSPLLIRDILRAVSNAVGAVLVLVGAYTAQGRMRLMARSLKQLQQIKAIPYTGVISNDRITFWCIVMYICGSFIIHTTENVIFTLSSSETMWSFFFSFFYLMQSIIRLLEMQLVAFASRIALTLEMVNKSLQHLEYVQSEYFSKIYSMNRYRKMPKVAWATVNVDGTTADVNNAHLNNDNTNSCTIEDISGTNASNKVRTEYIIRQLVVCYRHICDIIRAWTSSDGLLMILILINRILHMVQLLLILIMALTQNTDTFHTILVYTIINVIKNVVALVFFVEPFQRTHMQMERTSSLVQALRSLCGENRALSNELDLFLRSLKLQKASYSPLNICTLGRPLVLKIFGSLISYLVIILTYGPETKRPSPMDLHISSYFSNVENN